MFTGVCPLCPPCLQNTEHKEDRPPFVSKRRNRNHTSGTRQPCGFIHAGMNIPFRRLCGTFALRTCSSSTAPQTFQRWRPIPRQSTSTSTDLTWRSTVIRYFASSPAENEASEPRKPATIRNTAIIAHVDVSFLYQSHENYMIAGRDM